MAEIVTRDRLPDWLGRAVVASTSVVSALAIVAVTLFGLLLVTFVVGRMLPTDPVLVIVGEQATKEVYEEVYRQLNLDKPVLQQFYLYTSDMLAGRFGVSTITGGPVLQDIKRFLPATFELATVAILIGSIFGIALGFVGALFPNRWPDHLSRVVSLFGNSFPVFWLGLVGLLIFYARLGWAGGPGRLDITYQYTITEFTGLALVDTLLNANYDAFVNAVSHIVLPASILGLIAVGYIGRMTRAFLMWQLRQEYITVARLKGLSEPAILWRHALPNALGPIIAVIALTYAHLLEGAVLTETVFAWPGLGLYITQSLFAADLPPVLAGTLVVGITFMMFNTLAELIQGILDPRVGRAS